ncbi:hypothetical protein [Amphibacillus cookii]|uniref:hypothetical protein n=1 Tax=Amphibacillus cookii TaxID=767787 RepID=UPI00195E8F8A|nr:hypothetical protein [Amphibacillus cookii]MBM7539794.1 hypothetical protein [Amphibacillus cookii]
MEDEQKYCKACGLKQAIENDFCIECGDQFIAEQVDQAEFSSQETFTPENNKRSLNNIINLIKTNKKVSFLIIAFAIVGLGFFIFWGSHPLQGTWGAYETHANDYQEKITVEISRRGNVELVLESQGGNQLSSTISFSVAKDDEGSTRDYTVFYIDEFEELTYNAENGQHITITGDVISESFRELNIPIVNDLGFILYHNTEGDEKSIELTLTGAGITLNQQ